MSFVPSLVVVWGNCQAGPIAKLIEGPLAEVGLEVVHLPPVYEMTEERLRQLQTEVLPRTALLISQPIRDEYRIAGCGTSQLAALLPPSGNVVTYPITYDSSAFPYQARAHRGDGNRIDAPITDYHDLRAIVAAEKGFSVDQALEWWPTPSIEMVRANAAASRAELQRREADLDVHTSDLLADPIMFTLSHPTNESLVVIAQRILEASGLVDDTGVTKPEREFLGERRAPVESSVVEALGWDPCARRDNWVVAKAEIELREILDTQLTFYQQQSDVIRDTRHRFAQRLSLLNL